MTQDIQPKFLETLTDQKTPVTVFLICGVKLQGIITGFDGASFLLRRDNHTQLVYKHSVSTVMPAAPVDFDFEKLF